MTKNVVLKIWFVLKSIGGIFSGGGGGMSKFFSQLG